MYDRFPGRSAYSRQDADHRGRREQLREGNSLCNVPVSVSVSVYAFEPGSPGAPTTSAAGVFTTGLVRVLRSSGLKVRLRPMLAAEVPRPYSARGWAVAAGQRLGELGRLLGDGSRALVLVYPDLPGLTLADRSLTPAALPQAYRALGAKARLTGQRIVVIVKDLPVEAAEGRATAGESEPGLDKDRLRALEGTLFRAAHLLVVPAGFLDTIVQAHADLDASRLRTFRRHVYVPSLEPDAPAPPIEFESGTVNFFYSGRVDSQVAGNFREILRSIRNAPATRLHICGPGRDALREWLAELDVPNVRHYGQLGPAQHDWLARRCDAGLILYSTDNPYNHLRPTLKYSAYLANGLAVLSTDLAHVAENIRRDGVGQHMPIKELSLELLRWATRPALWAQAKARASERAQEIQAGSDMQPWIRELTASR